MTAHQGLSIRLVQPGELWLDRTGAVGPDPAKCLCSLGGDPDADGPGVAGVHGPADQAGVFEPSYLRGHRRLGAVIHRGQVADSRLTVGVYGRQQTGLCGRQLHLNALCGIAIESRDDGEQIRAQTGDSLLGRATLVVTDDVMHL